MRFAVDLIACAALGLVLWAACAGIGYLLLPPGDSTHPREAPASWRQPGIAACTGLGVLLMLGGIAVAVRIPWWVVVVPFVAVGLGLALREMDWHTVAPSSLSARRRHRVRGRRGVRLRRVDRALVGFRFPLHPWDDMRAYLPLATRLVDTNGLIEPWSARRLQNLGGFTFLQAMPVAIFGHKALGVIETMLASIFFAGLFVGNGFRSTWARVLSVGFIFAIPLLWVPQINTTGVLMGTPLLVAVLAVTVELRAALRADARSAALRWAVAGGLISTALYSVRPNLAVLAAGLLTLGALCATGTGVLGPCGPSPSPGRARSSRSSRGPSRHGRRSAHLSIPSSPATRTRTVGGAHRVEASCSSSMGRPGSCAPGPISGSRSVCSSSRSRAASSFRTLPSSRSSRPRPHWRSSSWPSSSSRRTARVVSPSSATSLP